jgi:predicted enzyme related to lactoylglutathione lyase
METTMSKIYGPSFVALQVRDLERAAQFYADMVGLERAPAGPPDAIVFNTKPIAFALRKPLVDLDASTRLGWGVALWFACENADALHAKLQAHDVPIAKSLDTGPFGRFFSFVDLDGYIITAHSQPAP